MISGAVFDSAHKNGNKKMATPPRFELKLTGPKPVVLPLHHGVAYCSM